MTEAFFPTPTASDVTPARLPSATNQVKFIKCICAANATSLCAVLFISGPTFSRRWCQWAQIYYQQLRKKGKSHAQAVRCLGQRWLKILWRMWQTKTVYDEAFHTRNQAEHGSWVLQLIHQKTGE